MRIERLAIIDAGRCAFESAELDERLAADQVLIRPHAALLCDGPAVSAFAGSARPVSLPCEVQAGLLGEVVSGPLPVGMRVACRGSVSTQVRARASECAAVPDETSDETALFFAVAQEAMASVRVAPPRLGENVVVLGQGVPGNLMAQLYRLSGAGQVAVVDPSAQRLAVAQQCGLEKTFPAGERPLRECLDELAPRGIELLCVAEEGLRLLSEALPFVAPHGIVTLQATPDEAEARRLWTAVVERSLAVLGAPGLRLTDERRSADAPLLMDWLAAGRLWTEPLCTHKLARHQAQDAFGGLRDRPDEFLGIMLQM